MQRKATTSGLQVVFGAGPVGLATARSLLEKGFTVKILSRSGRVPADFSASLGADAAVRLETGRVDAMDQAAMLAAAKGATQLYHCINTPYQDWKTSLEPIQEAIVAAAIAEGAVLAVADNLYMYSRGLAVIDENSERKPPSRKGLLRERLHQKLIASADSQGLRFVSIRASDFYGPGATWQSVFGTERFLDPLFAGKKPGMLGDIDVAHSYAYVGDFGRALAFAAHEGGSHGKAWVLPCGRTMTTREMAALFFAGAGKPPSISSIPRLAIAALGLFNPMIRELGEVLYQKEEPYIVDGSRFGSEFNFIPTSVEEAVDLTLAWYRSVSRN